MTCYDKNLELAKFLSMCLTFNSMKALICLKCLSALLNCDPNKVNKQWKKEVVIFALKPISRSFLTHWLQLAQAASILAFIHTDSDSKALISATFSPPFLPQAHAHLFFTLHSHLSWDTYGHFLFLLWKTRELVVRSQRWSSGSFPMLQTNSYNTGKSYSSALTGTSALLKKSSQVAFLNK